MNSNCINMNDFMYICIIVHVMLGSWVKVVWKSVCFCKNKGSKCMTFLQCPTCWLGKHSCGLIGTWVPGFLTILPQLVLTMFSPSFIWSLSTLVSFDIFSICSCPLPWELFLALFSPFVPWLSLLLLRVVLLEYECEFFSNMVQNDIEWICLCDCVFPSLVVHVVFCCYRCWLDVFSFACDYFSSSCNFYLIQLVVVILIALSDNCPMGSQSPVFPLNCYSWPLCEWIQRLVKHHYLCHFSLPVH